MNAKLLNKTNYYKTNWYKFNFYALLKLVDIKLKKCNRRHLRILN